MHEVWPEDLLAKKPEYKNKTMYEVLFKNGNVDKFPLEETFKRGYLKNMQSLVETMVTTWPHSTLITKPEVYAGQLSTAKKLYGATVKAMTPM